MKIERVNFAAAVMVDGTTRMSADYKIADIDYDPATMIYTVVGKTHGHVSLVHSTNIQWSRPLKEENEQRVSNPRGSRVTKEA